MNLRRTISLILTAPNRARHRHGFGVQSPWAYELVRDVFFETNHYYAYQEQHLATKSDQQLYRIRNHFRHHDLSIIDTTGNSAAEQYERFAASASPTTVLVIEHAHNHNAHLWQHIVSDPRAIITFDLGKRGLVVFDPKRIKQNYTL